MDQTTIDHLLAISTLAEASESLDRVADELIGLYDSWRSAGVADESLAWLGGLIGQLSWWSGRMTDAAYPDKESPSVPDGRATATPMATKRPDKKLERAVRDLVDSLAGGREKVAHLDKAVLSLRLAEAADWLARVEVMAAREHDGASWANVGQALGPRGHRDHRRREPAHLQDRPHRPDRQRRPH
jgi:hypothetical protein